MRNNVYVMSRQAEKNRQSCQKETNGLQPVLAENDKRKVYLSSFLRAITASRLGVGHTALVLTTTAVV